MHFFSRFGFMPVNQMCKIARNPSMDTETSNNRMQDPVLKYQIQHENFASCHKYRKEPQLKPLKTLDVAICRQQKLTLR